MDDELIQVNAEVLPIGGQEVLDHILDAQRNLDNSELHEFVCESCQLTVQLTDHDAYEAGWDYPPFLGVWGVVSPRTCGDCTIDKTAYFAILGGENPLSEHHSQTVARIMKEVPR